MEYRILDNGVGVILTRQPEETASELLVSFSGAPADATAIFRTEGGAVYYRQLSEDTCSLPIEGVRGKIEVTVALLNGEYPPRRWSCEGMRVSALSGGGLLVAPDDAELQRAVVELRLENQEIRQAYAALEAKYQALEARLESIMEGYDVT